LEKPLQMGLSVVCPDAAYPFRGYETGTFPDKRTIADTCDRFRGVVEAGDRRSEARNACKRGIDVASAGAVVTTSFAGEGFLASYRFGKRVERSINGTPQRSAAAAPDRPSRGARMLVRHGYGPRRRRGSRTPRAGCADAPRAPWHTQQRPARAAAWWSPRRR